jgi:hypothetical protein
MPLTTPLEFSGRRSAFTSETDLLRLPADEVNSIFKWMLQQQPTIPKPVSNAAFAKMWLLNVDQFRTEEQEMMASKNHEGDLAGHRFILLKLMAGGEAIINSCKEEGLAETPEGFKVEDLEATLKSLQVTFFCEHGPKNSEKQNQIIEGLFNGEKS